MSSSHVFLFLYCMAFDVLPYSYSQFLSVITQFSLNTAKPEFPLIYFMIKSVNKDVLFKESHDTLPVCRHSNPPAATRKCGHVTLSFRRHCHYRYYSKHLQLHFPEEQVR